MLGNVFGACLHKIVVARSRAFVLYLYYYYTFASGVLGDVLIVICNYY